MYCLGAVGGSGTFGLASGVLFLLPLRIMMVGAGGGPSLSEPLPLSSDSIWIIVGLGSALFCLGFGLASGS